MKKNINIILIILLIFLFTLSLGKVCDIFTIDKEKSFSVYQPGVEVLKNLKGTKYIDYVQRIYVNPTEENKLVILIKPNNWDSLTKKDKEIIISKIIKKWEQIYKNSKQDTELKPEVCFANI